MSKRSVSERTRNYWSKMYELRYFIWHLVKLDLRNKFRRSKLGMLWTFVSPLCLTLIMSVVFSIVFHYDIATYAPYILSGILFWDIMSSAFQSGAFVIISNQFYIRQCCHPYSLYTLKSTIVYLITFMIAMISLLCWLIFVNPIGILWGLLFIVPALIVYFPITWAGTTIAAYTGAKYRDYPLMIPLIMQALWYVSPVFFQEEMFKSSDVLYNFFLYSPITCLLNLIRSPFLYNRPPVWKDYGISLLFAALLCLWAWRIAHKNGKEIIFYL
ncbi:MAG: ABC transporter permease [Clostridia bacterium]|nr:ABC transporter permease [Clostridia bacterium]